MKNKRIAIICSLDGSANSIVASEIKNYLIKKGSFVELINTINLNKIIFNKFSPFNIINLNIYFFIFLNMLLNFAVYLQINYLKWSKKYLYYYLIIFLMKIRAFLLVNYFKSSNFDLIICETQIDSYYLLYEKKVKTLYHCPTPWADELYFGNEITKSQYKKLIQIEKTIYKKTTYLSFHSDIYNDYIKKYIYNGSNIISLNMGCSTEGKVKAQYKPFPKIIYVGFLDGYWININLLSYLSKIYPYIDVYGNPPPNKKYNLNYKGYLKNLDILSQYQFGLITISQDRLRKEGFSAKQLEYISHGLPVLVPEWRDKALNFRGTILYNKYNFLEKIKEFSDRTKWNLLSNQGYEYSKSMSWDEVLKPLSRII